MKPISILILTLAAGFAACSSDDDDNMQDSVQERLPLTIEVAENPLINPDAPAQARTTRGAITTTSTLSAFNLNYKYGDTPFTGKATATKDGLEPTTP